MRLRSIRGSYEYVDNSPYRVHDEHSCRGRWKEIFGNTNPVRLEVGCGRGSFITRLSSSDPGNNYVGLELYSNPIYRALKKAEELGNRNLLFLRIDAEFVTESFCEGEVDEVYINFPDPWPKRSKTCKRLTSVHFLEKYDVILKQDGRIIFKTDNRDLFEFSLEQAEAAGWDASEVEYDLHRDGNPGWNTMTDYEESFVSKGMPIHRVVFTRKKKE